MPAPVPAAAEPPLTVAELSARLGSLGPFERRPALAVAVSGGVDSMALAVLARAWVEDREGSLCALIVDHGLRNGSAGEAGLTMRRLAELGVPARILRWGGPKPRSGIQAAARAARYRLLEEACRSAGILHLLLGHHADDQAETVALRVAGGSGPRGLAAMPAIREVEGLRLLRPLLDVPRARLSETMRQRGIRWIEDPSNRDPRFARTRLRQAPVARAPVEPGRARAAEDRELSAFMAQRAIPHPLGFVRLDLTDLDSLPPLVAERLILTVSGRVLPPRRRALVSLVDRMSAGDGRLTLGGCILRRRGDELLVVREPRAAGEIVELAPGARCAWDGRFRVELAEEAEPGMLRRLGGDGHARLDPDSRRRALAIPFAARLGMPSLWRGTELAWHPFLDHSGTLAEIRCGFLPPLGLAPAPFVPANVVSNGDSLIYRQG